jgi:predicted ester cyclase
MSAQTTARHAANKRFIHDGLKALAAAAPDATEAHLNALYDGAAQCRTVHPINDLANTSEMSARFWQPLKRGFPDLERVDTLVSAGTHEGADIVACMGHYQATFAADFLGIPATHKATWIRYGEAHHVRDGRITASWMLVDLLDLMRQAGVWPVPDSLGAEGTWPSPAGGHGCDLDRHDPEAGAEALALVRAMHHQLLSFDGESLDSIDHDQYWAPNFGWYGPSGIGTTLGMAGFEAHHQIPFLTAFPDRKGGRHIVRIGDGPFAVTGGWPSVKATHAGDGWLGMPATGRRVDMRVMDFYRCENGLIAENWVPIDMIHILKQIGYDVFARLAHLRGSPRRSLTPRREGVSQ